MFKFKIIFNFIFIRLGILNVIFLLRIVAENYFFYTQKTKVFIKKENVQTQKESNFKYIAR
jgi:hypothetical protein